MHHELLAAYEDIRQDAERLGSHMEHMARIAEKQLIDHKGEYVENIEQAVDTTLATAKQRTKEAKEFAAQHPLAVAITGSIAAGVVIGYLLSHYKKN